jgi:multidrug efflux pump subunit AcrB
MQSRQDVQVGGRISRTQYQFTLEDPDLEELNRWAPQLASERTRLPQLQDVASDLQISSPEDLLTIDRDAAARLGVDPQVLDDTLYDALGQRQVATIFSELSQYHVALIGVILLIGIVKKNAIMMIDFALTAERAGKSTHDAIYEAALIRFRPIMMTTMAALLGGMPLALGTGAGSELRSPLGISIVGGLIVSQILTLYTTPVIYLYLDPLNRWFATLSRHRYEPDKITPRIGIHT